MKEKTTLFILLLLIISIPVFSQTEEDYCYKIDNRIINDLKSLPKDSSDFIYTQCYSIALNFHHELIKEDYNEYMHKIDNLGSLDSVCITNKFGRKSDKMRMIIGNNIPYKISLEIINHFFQIDSSNMELILYDPRPELGEMPPNSYESRRLYVGALQCPYHVRKKYLRNPKSIRGLLQSKNRTEYLAFFRENDEEIARLNKHIKSLDARPRFPGCEDIEDVELKRKCSNEKYKEYCETFINPKIDIDYKGLTVNLFIDENGRIMVKGFGDRVIDKFKPQLTSLFEAMPAWIPQKKYGKNIGTMYYISIDLTSNN